MALFVSRNLITSDIVQTRINSNNVECPIPKKKLSSVDLKSGRSCKVFAVVVDRRGLTGQAASLSHAPDVNTKKKENIIYNSSQDAWVAARTVYSFQQMVNNPKLGDDRCWDKPSKKKNTTTIRAPAKKKVKTEKEKKEEKPKKEKPKKKKNILSLSDSSSDDDSSPDDDSDLEEKKDEPNVEEPPGEEPSGTGGGSDEEAQETMEEVEEEVSFRYPMDSGVFSYMGHSQEKIEQYIQVIKLPDGIPVAFRFIYVFFADSQDFDFNRALDNLLIANNMFLAKLKKSLNKASIENLAYYSKNDWCKGPLSDNAKFTPTQEAAIVGSSFQSNLNPGSVTEIFSFEKSCLFLKNNFPELEKINEGGIDLSCTEISDQFNPLTGRLRFVNDTFYVTAMERHQAIIHHCKLFETPDDRLHLRFVDQLSQERYIVDMHRRIIKENALETSLKMAIPTVNVELNPITGLRDDVDKIDLIFRDVSSMKPGVVPCVEYIETKIREGRLRNNGVDSYCVERCDMDELIARDSKMSPFAQMVARNLAMIEHLFLVQYYHGIAAFLLMWVNGIFDYRDSKFFVHVAISGPPGSGKSWLMKLLEQMMLKDTFHSLSYQTEKSYCTNINNDFQFWFFDETPDSFFAQGSSSSGNSLLKTVMSKQELSSMSIFIDEFGNRHSTVTKANLECCILLLLNASEDKLPAAIASRVLFIKAETLNRPNYSCTMKIVHMENTPELKLKRNVAITEKRTMQSLVAKLMFAVHQKYVPDVDLTYALNRLHSIKLELEKFGITIVSRKDEQLCSSIRTCAINEAVYRVFFLEKQTRTFERKQLIECSRFMFATEEHVVYTLTQLEGCLCEENLPSILRALKAKCKLVDPSDVNSYLLEMNMAGSLSDKGGLTSDTILSVLAGSISSYINKTEKRYMLLGNVVYVLKLLLESVHRGRRFKSADSDTDTYIPPPGDTLPCFEV